MKTSILILSISFLIFWSCEEKKDDIEAVKKNSIKFLKKILYRPDGNASERFICLGKKMLNKNEMTFFEKIQPETVQITASLAKFNRLYYDRCLKPIDAKRFLSEGCVEKKSVNERFDLIPARNGS